MKTASALAVLAIGAILAFAVTAQTPYINIQIVGWVLICTGAVGLFLPRRGRDWLRRSVLIRGPGNYAAARQRRGIGGSGYRRSTTVRDGVAAPGDLGPGDASTEPIPGVPGGAETVREETIVEYPPT
ncbi:MAG: hypothetical protein M0030_14615 [Actinomycetota bacterium]|nr:hypothetical protein [Actinomycetota bacterium]